jgi:hypothetical protein
MNGLASNSSIESQINSIAMMGEYNRFPGTKMALIEMPNVYAFGIKEGIFARPTEFLSDALFRR